MATKLDVTANPAAASFITNVVQTWATATGQTEATVRAAFGVVTQVGAPLPPKDDSNRRRFSLAYGLAVGLGAGVAVLAVAAWYFLVHKKQAAAAAAAAAAGDAKQAAAV